MTHLALLFALCFVPGISLHAAPAGAEENSAATIQCQGSALFPGGYATGNCNSGSCVGFLPGESVSVTGSCGSTGTQFHASGFVPGNSFNASCFGHSLNTFVPGGTYLIDGTCSTGQSFHGEIEREGGYVQGPCQENGPINVFVPGQNGEVMGQCS